MKRVSGWTKGAGDSTRPGQRRKEDSIFPHACLIELKHFAMFLVAGVFNPGLHAAMVPDRLTPILEQKQREIARLLPRVDHLRNAALLRNDFRGFAAAVDRGPEALGLIAEVKKASPSAGVIAADFDPVRIATEYEAAGAHAISVLTDEQFFQGHLSYLTRVRESIELPCLRKDFIIHESQIFEAAVAGADAILLIVAALGDAQLRHLLGVAETCQLDVLVEVHTLEELDRALALDVKLLGINNRNLTTFEVDLETTERLSEQVPDDVILVAESGLKTTADTQRVYDCGCNAILVGESLMRTGDIAAQVKELLGVQAAGL
jgi:indole-3-glycerol phosphate synthase